MSLLARLSDNKGTVSSALGKRIAAEILEGKTRLLDEAVELCSFDVSSARAKGLRAGAAKIVEQVAVARPQLLAGRLAELGPALHVPESQTRWMIIHTFGACAHLDPKAADAFETACGYLDEGAGVCLSAAAARYLGDVGSLSPSAAESAYRVLDGFLVKAGPNEVDWMLESLDKIAPLCSEATRERIAQHATGYLESSKAAQRKRAAKLLKTALGY